MKGKTKKIIIIVVVAVVAYYAIFLRDLSLHRNGLIQLMMPHGVMLPKNLWLRTRLLKMITAV